MSEARWAAVDGWIGERLLPPDPVLDAALTANAAAGLPAIDVSPAHARLLLILARMVGARRILEIGTLGGFSTIHLARAPKSNAVARAIWQAREDVRREGIQPPPASLRDAHYKAAAKRGHGVGYVSPHEDPAAALADHLPEGMEGRTYYRPSSTSEDPKEGTRDDRHG